MEKLLIPYIEGAYSTYINPNKMADMKKKSEYFLTQEDTKIKITCDNDKWYINDHCFICDKKDRIHFFGIHNPYPRNSEELYRFHPYIAHYVSARDRLEFNFVEMVFDELNGTQYLGAPYIVYNEKTKEYIMIFESLIEDKRVLEIATSPDLYKWKRSKKSILDTLNYTKRDPCIIEEDGVYYIYLCNPQKQGSSVELVMTRDFEHFTNETCLYVNDGSNYGGIESPYVLKKGDLYYMFFTYAHRHYSETIVLASKEKNHFSMNDIVTTLYGHACEIFTFQEEEYISTCGPEDEQEMNLHGLEIAKLKWK